MNSPASLKRISLLVGFVFLFGGGRQASAQITAELIAARISADSGDSPEGYREYSEKLATLLSTYTPAALRRILGENSALAPQTLNETLELRPINFAFGSAALSSGSFQELDKVMQYLTENPNAKILIEGHVSETYGGAQALSESRARAAKLYLAQQGIDPARLESVGRGHDSPIEGGTDEQNRRIAITVID